MKSRLSIVMIAIAALIANEAVVNAQDYGWPDQQAQGYAPPGYAQQAAAYAQPPIAYPQMPVGPLPEGAFGDMGGGGEMMGFGPMVDPPYPWRYWGGAEAILWWRQGGTVPALFTSSPSIPAPGTPRQINNVPNATVLGNPATTTLFGGGNVMNDPTIGGNVFAGMWLDELREVGIGARGYGLAKTAAAFNAFSDPTAGGPDIGRPFFNTSIGLQDSFLVAFRGPNNPPGDPAVLTLNRGSVVAAASNQVYGGELNVRVNWDRAPGYSLDIIGGYVYARINDNLSAGHDFVDLDPFNLIPDGTRFQANDSFACVNNFHGAQMGISSELQSGRWTARLLGKVAFGDMNQRVTTAGDSTITVAGVPVTSANGFFNRAGINSGTFVRDQFSIMPEANLMGGYQLTDNINVSFGYTFIYWTRVATAGNMVPVNKANAFAATPFAFRDGDFWLQGMNLGVSARF